MVDEFGDMSRSQSGQSLPPWRCWAVAGGAAEGHCAGKVAGGGGGALFRATHHHPVTGGVPLRCWGAPRVRELALGSPLIARFGLLLGCG